MWLIGLFASGCMAPNPNSWLRSHANPCNDKPLNAIIYNLVLYDVFKMIVTKLFYFDLSGIEFCQKILRSRSFKQKLRHQMVEAVETKAIEKLPLPHPWIYHCCSVLTFLILSPLVGVKAQFFWNLYANNKKKTWKNTWDRAVARRTFVFTRPLLREEQLSIKTHSVCL